MPSHGSGEPRRHCRRWCPRLTSFGGRGLCHVDCSRGAYAAGSDKATLRPSLARTIQSMKTISLLSLCFVLGACGGSVASVDDSQRPPGSVESDGQREPSDPSPAEATSPSQPAAPSCSAVPIPVTG